MSRTKRGRNQPCHCGSGRKHKHCCLDQDRRKAWLGRSAGSLQGKMERKVCLAPEKWRQSCSRTVCKAHTVPRSSLNLIAEDGHVLSFKPNLRNLKKHGPAMPPQRQGVGSASTFTGFCAKHDDQIFSPLEKAPFEGTPEQCFLVAYRALARELHVKSAVASFNNSLGDPSDSLGPLPQPAQSWLHGFKMGTLAGVRNMRFHKSEHESCF